MQKKVKVALICHFSNEQIRKSLPLSDRRLINLIRKFIGKTNTLRYGDFAPWNSCLIKEFENIENIDLHIIAPHAGLKKRIAEFEMNQVNYHFFKPSDDFLYTMILNKFGLNQRPEYTYNRKSINKIIKSIKPDVINLIGVENLYYSLSILDIKNIPVYVSLQTIITNPTLKNYNIGSSYSREMEMKIHKKEKYFGCNGRLYRDLLLKNNPDAFVFKMFFCIQKPPQIEMQDKEYDFVFFAARVLKNKGIEDTIDALCLAKKKMPNITLNIVGSCLPEYKEILVNKIETLDLTENITFHDYFQLHEDMFRQVLKSKVAVVPGITAVINGTVLEPMFLGLPVVTYKTTGTPYLNREKECVLLAEIGDIEGLASCMLKLKNDETYAKTIAANAKEFVSRTYDNTVSAKRLVSNYKAIMANYHHNTSIPEELLFDINEFPIY